MARINPEYATSQKLSEVAQMAAALWEGQYGTESHPLADMLSIERVTHSADGYHVRGYISGFGFVHCLIDDETADLLDPVAE